MMLPRNSRLIDDSDIGDLCVFGSPGYEWGELKGNRPWGKVGGWTYLWWLRLWTRIVGRGGADEAEIVAG